jgi:histidinol-phosphate aminotransferase
VIRARRALDGIPNYVPGRSAEQVAGEHDLTDVVKLASNEGPFAPLPAALEAIAAAAANANRYPDDGGATLREALAAHYRVEPDQVLLGGGSVALCQQVLLATVDPGDKVVFGWPSFEAYPILAQQVDASIVRVPLRDQRYDLDAMAERVTRRTRLVFVCNPNNPTGTVIGRAEVERFLARVPDDLLVVFDEAYREFVTTADFPDGVELLRSHPNVAVLRTFSKAYGLAGLRVGYAIATPAVIGVLRKTRVPFGVSSVAQAAAVASLAAQDEIVERIASVVGERGRVVEAIRELGMPVVESHANFVWLPVPAQARALGAYLEQRGVVVRPFADVGVRVTIGAPDENDRLLKLLAAAVDDGVVPAQ